MKNKILLPGMMGVLLLAGCTERQISYQADVQPILADNCLECHQPGGKGANKTGLLMNSHDALMKGTNFGSIIQAGDPLTSILNQVVEGRVDKSIRMPHGGKTLTKKEQQVLSQWVAQGAKNN